MSKLKKLLEEFKKFISRGNVVDMAVGVIIASAFTAIVTAVTKGLLMPLVNWAVRSATGGVGLSGLRTILGEAVYTTDANGASIIDWTNTLYIDWGTFINSVVDFLLIAVILFAILKIFTTLRKAAQDANSADAKRKRKLTRQYLKEGLSYEQASKKAEEVIAAENVPAPAAPPAPTTEELLTQIRDLLAAQNAAQNSDAQSSEKAE
ncbi:MAG: large conductance mechanosensitive channel protein MscL [Candidatus Coproplasma sp.]